jgi:iron complex outermembrane receptor protein
VKIVLNILIFFSTFFIYSQNYIKGTTFFVDNLGEKKPLAGVNILWKNTSEGTLSDINGDFKILSSNFSNNLVFKFLGYKDQIVQYKNQSDLIIVMIEDENILDEVVVDKKEKDNSKIIL